MNKWFIGTLFLAAIAGPRLAFADQVSLGALKDNTLYEDGAGSLSNGAGIYCFAGRTAPLNGGLIRRAVMAFDIANNIPPGATINNVTLTLNMSRTISGAQTIDLHKLVADWGEGFSDAPGQEGGGAAATAGDATWIHKFAPADFWATAGGDFAAGSSADVSVGGLGPYVWGSTAAMVADVQDWLDNPANNFGWMLIGDESVMTTAKRFDTREMTVAANRPELVVDYTPADSSVPAASEWGLAVMTLVLAVVGTLLLGRPRGGYVGLPNNPIRET